MTYTKKQVKQFLRRHLKGRRDVKYGIVTLKRRGRKQYKSFLKKIRRGLFKYRFILIVYYRNHCTGVYINKKGIVNSRHHIPSQLRNDLKRTGVLFQTRSTRRPKKFIDSYMLYNLIKDVRGTNNVYNTLQAMNRYRRAPVHHHYYAQAGPNTIPTGVQNGRRQKAVRFALRNTLNSRHSNISILDQMNRRMKELANQLNVVSDGRERKEITVELNDLEQQITMFQQNERSRGRFDPDADFDEQTGNSEGLGGRFEHNADFDADVESSESLQEQAIPDGRRQKRFHDLNAREMRQHEDGLNRQLRQRQERNRSNRFIGGSTGDNAGFSRTPQSRGGYLAPRHASLQINQEDMTPSLVADIHGGYNANYQY